MNSKERISAAMNLQKPDRVPVMCQLSIGHMLRQLDVSPVDFWFDKNTFIEGLIYLRSLYKFDGILVSLSGHFENWKERIISHISKNGESIVKTIENENLQFLNNELPINTAEYSPVDLLSNNNFILPEVLSYIPVSQNLKFYFDPGNPFNTLTDIIKKVNGDFSIHGEITSPFDYLLDLAGHQESLMALLLEPVKCHFILKHFTALIKQYACDMCETGIDAIKISSPFAGEGFISPEMYSEFVLPYEKEIANAVREKDIHIYTHTCGAINDRLELMFDTGISGIECLDPAPLGNVELEDAFNRIGTRGFIKGNIDSVNTLLYGDKNLIEHNVKEIISTGIKYNGFILSTACSVAPEVDSEKLKMLTPLAESFGKYE